MHLMQVDDFTEAWYQMDSIATTVEANGYQVWSLRLVGDSFRLELAEHVDSIAADNLCGQFMLAAYYDGEGEVGTAFCIEK